MHSLRLAVLLLLIALASTCAAAPNFRISALALPRNAEAVALNDAGDLLFYDFVSTPNVEVAIPTLQVKGRPRAFGHAVSEDDSVYMDGVFPDTPLNAHGQSVGFKRVDGEVVGDVTRDRNQRDHLLPEPTGGGYTDQFDINDRGHVVASLRDPQHFGSRSIALWSRRRVNRIDFGQWIDVIALNNADQVLIRRLESGIPALWDEQNGVTDIAWPDDRYQVLTGDTMSDEGVITGRARRGRRNFAYVLDESGFRLISPPTGGIKMEPRFVNDAGDVVGLTTFEVGGGYETFFAASGEITASRLDALITNLSGWNDLDIVGMNNLGQIIGNGKLNGEQKPFVLNRVAQLSPVPEPSALLRCVGLTLAVANRRHRPKAKPRGRRGPRGSGISPNRQIDHR